MHKQTTMLKIYYKNYKYKMTKWDEILSAFFKPLNSRVVQTQAAGHEYDSGCESPDQRICVWVCVFVCLSECVRAHVSVRLQGDVMMAGWNIVGKKKSVQSTYRTVSTGAVGGRGWGSLRQWMCVIVCVCVLLYQNSLQERNRIFLSTWVQGAWGCCWRGEIKCERHSHTGGASTEHSWHYSLLTNNPNFIQWAGPAEWLLCVEFTHWRGGSVQPDPP